MAQIKKSKNKSIDVSFLILNYNGKHLMKIILDSIRKIKFSGKYEVVVVDNASSDDSVAFMKLNYPQVKIVQNSKNLGTSGINLGIPSCSGKYIFYLNNDIEVSRDCLQVLFDRITSDDKAGLVAPLTINYYNRSIKSGGYWISRAFYGGHYLYSGDDSVKEVPYAGIFLFRKEIASKLGYVFDPDYFIYSEDLDFGLRSRLIGYKILLMPTTYIYHMHAATMKKQKNSNSLFYLERNLLSTFLKVMSLKSIILLAPYVFLLRALAIARDILKADFANAYSRTRAVFWVLANLSKIKIKRSNLQKLRKISDRELLRLFSEKYIFKPKPLPL